ncbi:MAG: hypothetical protein AABW56_01000 [Nanoarchaeota archaeon]
MKYNLLKQKAVIQILLIISLSFYTSLSLSSLNKTDNSLVKDENKQSVNYFDLIKQDLLTSVDAQTKVCCELTKSSSQYSGESCVFTDLNDCDTSTKPSGTQYQTSSVSCLETDFCGAGVCILGGTCGDNVEKGLCLQRNGVWRSGTSDQISQCRIGCCDLPSGASLTTDDLCRDKVKIFPDLRYQDVFKPEITDQVTCSQQSRSAEEGCCVLPDQCSFVTRKACNELNGDFKLNNLCSNPGLGCQVTAKHSTICYQNKVYWTDSFGNRENVYDGKFDASWQYTNWLVQDSDRLAVKNPQTLQEVAQSGNCQFSLGSICGEISDGVKNYLRNTKNLKENDVNKIKNQCISLNCLKTQKNPNIPWMDERLRQNGESWCEYQSKTGNGEDLVGTRHIIHQCENGVETFKECGTRRKEICVQNDVPANVTGVGKDLTFAACAPNNWQVCLGSNQDTESCGLTVDEAVSQYNSLYGVIAGFSSLEVDTIGPCKDFNSDSEKYKSCRIKTICRKTVCEEQVLGNCYFNKDVGLCAPAVPPGTLGKEAEFEELSNGESIGFNFDAKMYLAESTTFGSNPEFGEDCAAGCGVHTSEFANKWNDYCTSLGDLGAKYNIAGKYSKSGFYHGGPFNINGDVDNDDNLNMNAQGTTITKQFNYYLSNIKPLTGNIYSLLEAINNLKVINFERLKDPDFLKSWWGDVGAWFASAGIAGGLIAGGIAIAGGIVPLAEALNIITIGGVVAGPIILVVIAIVAVFVLLNLIFGQEAADLTYKLQCMPWVPPSGGQDCRLCNDESKFSICDEYTCKSLGKACGLINKGQVGNETCIWSNRNTVPPIIGPKLYPPFDEQRDIQKVPPSTGFTGGYKFKNEITAFTSIDIGIKIINERGQEDFAECKISRSNTFNYEDSNIQFFDDSLTKSEHKRKLLISQSPILPDEDRIELEAGKVNTFYIKCKGPNDAINLKPYFIEISVAKGPDTAPPEIKSFSIKNNAFIPYNLNQTLLNIYIEDQSGLENITTNRTSGKDGGCKYSTVDQDYELMPYDMSCTHFKVNPEGQYLCTTLLNLKPNQDNSFYFRCKDLAKNVNPRSMPPIEGDTTSGYHLKGTQQLIMTDSGPIGDYVGTDVNLTLTTSQGAESGKSTCYYAGGIKEFITRDLTFSASGIKFTSTNSDNHETKLSLQNEQDYIYYVWCRDVAGNEAKDVIEFHTTTPDLIIEDAGPNEQTFYTDKIQLSVTTSGGIKGDGDSTCSYNGDMNGYFNEGKTTLQDRTTHVKNVTLVSSGITYNVNITCSDQYKSVTEPIEFTVNYAAFPQIIRLFRQQNVLNILLNNPAECRYSLTNANFDFNQTTTKMIPANNNLQHSVQISSSVIYIKCKDTRTNNIGPSTGSYKVYP